MVEYILRIIKTLYLDTYFRICVLKRMPQNSTSFPIRIKYLASPDYRYAEIPFPHEKRSCSYGKFSSNRNDVTLEWVFKKNFFRA